MGIAVLLPGKEKKILNFYPNIYADEIGKLTGDPGPGEIVTVTDREGAFIAKGYYSPESAAVIRVLTLDERKIDGAWFTEKIAAAFERRRELLSKTNCVRAFYAEGDGIPGLIIDYFDRYVSIQFRNHGVEAFREDILRAVKKALKPLGIYEKSDIEIRIKEGERGGEGVLYGEIPPRILMEDRGVRYAIDLVNGQKTGFFLDQRDSRAFISPHISKKTKFLDVFSSSGGFSMRALADGAAKVVAIDKDAHALELARENYALNGFTGEFRTLEGDALGLLQSLSQKSEKYDIITLDPPALVKKKTDVPRGRDIFLALCGEALKLLEKDGILGVMSCAYYITLQDLLEVTRMAGSKNRKTLAVLGVNYQPADHPWLLQIPETLYLKALWVKIN